MKTVIDAHTISKTFNPDTIPVKAVDNVHLHLERGEFTALVGPSGSGKTTLLNLIGGLDKPDTGNIMINGVDITTLSPNALIDFRLHNIGFVFQSFQLMPSLTALENVMLPLELSGNKNAKTAAIAALTWAANSIILLTGTATASVQALAAHIVTLLQSSTAADARTAIGAGTGNGDLLASNNLSDVTASTARTNLAVSGLAVANTFTAAQMVDGSADAIQLRVQGHSTQTNIFQTWEDSSANVLVAVTKIDTNSGRINNYVGNSIVSSWYPSGSTVRFTTASGYDLVFLNHGAELMRGTSLGRLGIGTTSAQGKLHVYDTGGGFLHRYASGVNGSATTIIADATGDVTLCLSGTFTISDGAGNTAGGVITKTVPGGTFNLYDDGGTNTCQLQISAGGAVTVIRTAGSRTYAVNLQLNWM